MSEARYVNVEHAPEPGVSDLSMVAPVGLAAGFDRDGKFLRQAADWGFGFLEIGTVTPTPQPGHNSGVSHVAEVLHAHTAPTRRLPIGVNVGTSANSPPERAWRDYARAVTALWSCADYVVLNFSSQSASVLRNPDRRGDLIDLLERVQRCCTCLRASSGRRTPVLIKWPVHARNVPDAMDIAADAGALGYDGLLAAFDDNGSSGSWECWVPDACRDIVARCATLPVIGVGGVDRAARALSLKRAGAALVQMHRGFVEGGPARVAEVARAWSADRIRDWPLGRR